MPKTLLLLRHGKTYRGGYNRDWDRELKRRGENQAEFLGDYLLKTRQVPDKILTSSALRARATAEICASRAGYSDPIEAVDELYGIGGTSLIRFISELDDSFQKVLLVGHNPAFEEAVSRLSGRQSSLGTGDCAVVRYSIDTWKDLASLVEPESVEIIRSD